MAEVKRSNKKGERERILRRDTGRDTRKDFVEVQLELNKSKLVQPAVAWPSAVLPIEVEDDQQDLPLIVRQLRLKITIVHATPRDHSRRSVQHDQAVSVLRDGESFSFANKPHEGVLTDIDYA